ncbi:MAG TPA: membrane protein insertase YidC [Actinoplanes sp.]|nr:membrane protein insertase YidC [Actinoplanes sp.]
MSHLLAIILFTIAVRLLISPLTYLQVRAERRRTALAPRIAELREKYPDEPLTLAAETLALQREAGAGPAVSLLPVLAQVPFFMLMFHTATTDFAVSGGLALVATLAGLAAGLAWWNSRRLTGWLRALPFLTVPAVLFLPPAGGIYLVTSTAWTVLENTVWRRPSG